MISSIFEALRLLTPYGINKRKVRVGSKHDGGYVMVDDFTPGQMAFSYGLSWNVQFEHDLAARGLTVFMFDHTIDVLSVHDQRCVWIKEGIAARTNAADYLSTLDDHIARLAPRDRGMILKMDVEGAEWDVLAAAAPEILRRFDQIVLEMHELSRIGEEDWRQRFVAGMSKLAAQFVLHHVHANNHGPLVVLGNCFPVADVIEVSYIRTDLVERSALAVPLPGHLDAPNDPGRPEIPLWFFPFNPTSGAATHLLLDELMSASVARSGLYS